MDGAPIIQVGPLSLEQELSVSKPADILELGSGSYSGFVIPNDGEPLKPIVIRSSARATVAGTVDARYRKYVHVVGLTANRIRFGLSKRVSIMYNKVVLQNQYDGIGAWKRAEDGYVADNEVIGPIAWQESALGASGDNWGECILVTGPGHVIAHNKVSGCRDNISFLEGEGQAVDQFCIDVIGIDIYNATDDGGRSRFLSTQLQDHWQSLHKCLHRHELPTRVGWPNILIS